MVRVSCLGGSGSVTGSCFLIETPTGTKILVDCGLFQGGRTMEARNRQEWGFDPRQIRTVFLTHAHIDHSGRLPMLVRDGFQGRILTSHPTAELSKIMLLDAAHIQEMDAEWQTRRNRRQSRNEILPLYTTEDAEASLKHIFPVKSDAVIDVEPGVKARLRDAGHILGSSILEIWIQENRESMMKIVFSGDLGKKNQLIVRDPHEIFDSDYLFLESTYGNRLHRSFEESKEELLEAIRYAVSNGEKVIIPAFAVERTQEILYILAEFHRNGLLPKIPVYLDSPLAIKATEIFRKSREYYDEDAKTILKNGNDPFDVPDLHLTQSTRESQAINERSGSAVVIAGNGMATAGRIKHHLKHNLWRPGASLVIVGFQAEGSTGRRIVDGARVVKIFGEPVSVRAKVFTIGGFSAHADQKDLLEWVSHFESRPKIFTIHGEQTASETLAERIRERFHLDVYIPKWKERLILKAREVTREIPVQVEAPDVRESMLNLVTDLENELAQLKEQIHTTAKAKVSDEEVDRLRFIKEEIRTVASEYANSGSGKM
ncbi:MAG: MBL fold metallo-hydrolase [Desulfobacteraceae bacterium]|nr:MAG: MBL fold metallo-hydrolase [Desulfobacteraceae bacterium]